MASPKPTAGLSNPGLQSANLLSMIGQTSSTTGGQLANPLGSALGWIFGGSKSSPPPNPLIPLADFLRYVEDVERGYPNDTPEQILTRIRNHYYSGMAFDNLIPHSPYLEVVGTRNVNNYREGEYYEDVPITARRKLDESKIGAAAYRDLTARADENATGDNPSPYIVLPNGQRVDLGHTLLGVDALLHPLTSKPYSDYNIPNIDPSSWVADLGIASAWMTEHEESGSPHGDVVNPPATADLTAYYNNSAPLEDLLGDVDSFGIHAQWKAASGQRLSAVCRAYYTGTGATSMQHRFRIFCTANSLKYTLNGNSVTWDAALASTLIPRIDRFIDLYAAGKFCAAITMISGHTHSGRAWPRTPAVLDRFLTWVKTNLEAEIAASSGP